MINDSRSRPLLRRRNVISTVSILIVPDDQSDSYTSIKDLLPYNFPVNSPMPSSQDICIRDPLVKQAAWAYLQPVSASSSASVGSSFFFHRLAAFTDFLSTHVIRAFHWMFRFIRVHKSI